MEEKTVSTKEIYKGRSFSFFSDKIKLPDNRTATRDYVKYPKAVAIIPFADSETVILVEQYRYSVGRVMLEIPAGKIDDPSEPPENAAKRELLEETGYDADSIEFLFSFYPAVGYSTEEILVYRADNLTAKQQDLDEDEFIDVRHVKIADALDMIKRGGIKDSKTILALLYLKV